MSTLPPITFKAETTCRSMEAPSSIWLHYQSAILATTVMLPKPSWDAIVAAVLLVLPTLFSNYCGEIPSFATLKRNYFCNFATYSNYAYPFEKKWSWRTQNHSERNQRISHCSHCINEIMFVLLMSAIKMWKTGGGIDDCILHNHVLMSKQRKPALLSPVKTRNSRSFCLR